MAKKEKILSGIRMKDMQLFLDECAERHEAVFITALTRDGRKLQLDGWICTSGHWKGGTHNFRHPDSGQVRKVRDVLIFAVNGHPVYI